MSVLQPMIIRFLLRWFPRLLVLCGLLGFGAFLFQAYTTPDHDVRGGLRGNTILIVRLPILDGPREQIWLAEDGTATRGWITNRAETSGTLRRDVQIQPTLLQQILALRTTWCTSPAAFSELQSDDSFYDAGCSVASCIPLPRSGNASRYRYNRYQRHFKNS